MRAVDSDRAPIKGRQMTFRKTVTAIAMAFALTLLAACDSSEERAEAHFQKGLTYIESGDVDRALVEFRNVFKLNGRHKEARRSYAEAERNRGRLREAFAQYLRLVEDYPDDLDALQALAEIAAQSGDWAAAEKHVTAALALAPQDKALLAIRAVADYGLAIDANDVTGLLNSARAARDLRTALPDNLMLRRVIIDDLIRAQDFDAAMMELDSAIALAPKDRTLLAQRLSIHAAQGNEAAVEAGLRDMMDRFPEAPEMRSALVRWHVLRKEFDKAEAVLRDAIEPASPDPTPVINLVRFLAEHRGTDAAIGELDRNIVEGERAEVFRSARAGFLFDLGRRDEAITEMQTILQTATASDDTRRIKVGLARMLVSVGNAVGARALVEEVLAEDSGEVEALKLKAAWLILDDQVGDAIAILRRALDNNPRDASVMTLMAQAYERDGNRDLLRETLSQAVIASNRGPDESLRYAQLLISEGKLLAAESVLIDSLRIAPGNAMILVPLGQLYLQLQDWPRAGTVADELESLDDRAATAAAAGLHAAIFGGRQQTDEAIGYLQSLVDRGEGGLNAKIAIIRSHLANGQNDKALSYAAALRTEDPENPDVQFIEASVQALTGNGPAAEAAYRTLVDVDPTRLPVWMALFRQVATDPARSAEAGALIDRALAANPNAGELKWAKAGLLERGGDIEGAIAVYEGLYKENSANPIVANNLASLLSSYRSDGESLARAEIIARRLRGSTVAPYQDTFGWIAYQRGHYQDAVNELQKAATGLPEDPTVQYHLAMAYLALDRRDEALEQFRKVTALAGTDANRPAVTAVTAARDEIARIEAGDGAAGN